MNENKLIKVVTKKDISEIRDKEQLISIAIRLPCNCNLDCTYCYGKIKSKGKIINFNDIKNVLKQASELNARTVEIVGEGEALLYPNFRKLIEYIDVLDMIPTLYSNCILINKEMAKFLFNHNTTVIGKQNSLSPNKQDKICNVKGSFENIMNGINNLIEAGFTEKKPSRLAIHTVILKENLSEIPEMWRQWRHKNILPQVQVLVYPSKNQGPQYFEYYRNHSPTPEETRKLFESLSRIDKEEFGFNWNPLSAYPIAPDGCKVIYGTIGITQEGNIQICSFTEDPIGNIRDISLKDILKSDKVKKIRDTGRILDYPNQGYGCRANTYNITCDRFAKDPFYEKFLSAKI